MQNLIALVIAFLLASCGYTSVDNTVVGQIKNIRKNTPILCPDYTTVDISLGVIKNGTGSMSKEDMTFYVPNTTELNTLNSALISTSLVKIRYDRERFGWCRDITQVLKSVEIIK